MAASHPHQGLPPAPRALQEQSLEKQVLKRNLVIDLLSEVHTRVQPFFRLTAYPEIHLFLHTSLARFPLPPGWETAEQARWGGRTQGMGASGSRGVGAVSCQASLPCPLLRMGLSFPVSVTTLALMPPLPTQSPRNAVFMSPPF